MGVFLPRRWRRQPTQPVGIDWSHPLARGLLGSFSPVDNGLATQSPATVVGSISRAAGPDGIAWRGAYQASTNYVSVDRGRFDYTAQVTFEALVRVSAFQTTVFPYISGVIGQFHSVDGAADFRGPFLRFNPDAAIGNAAVPTFSIQQTGTSRTASGSAVSAGVLLHMLGTYDGAAVSLYINGTSVGSTAVTGAFDNHASNIISLISDYALHAPSGGQNRCLNGDLYLARIYKTGKTAAEARALAENPWGLYQPIVRRVYFLPAGGATPQTTTASLDTLVQAALSATAGLTAAVQAAQSTSASVDLAVQSPLTAAASLDIAVRAAQEAAASLSVAVQAPQTASADLDIAVQAALSASASLDLAVQAAQTATAGLTAAVQAAQSVAAGLDLVVIEEGATTLFASLDLAVQAAQSAVAGLTLAVQEAKSNTASLDLRVVVAGQAAASLDMAVQAARTATVGLTLYVIAEGGPEVYSAIPASRLARGRDVSDGKARPAQLSRRRRLN